MKIPAYAKPVEGSGKVLHDWKDLFGGTSGGTIPSQDLPADIQEIIGSFAGDIPAAVKKRVLPDAFFRPRGGPGKALKKRIEAGREELPDTSAKGPRGRGIKSIVKKIVDTADSELSKMGKGAKRAAGFTKKKFGDAVNSAIEGMGMEDRKTAMADMEGGKFSLHAPEWGIHKGSDLSRAFHSIVGAGPKKAQREKRQEKAKAKKAGEGAPSAPAPKPQKKSKAQQKAEASARMKKAWADGRFGAKKGQEVDFGPDDDELDQAQNAGSRIKDPLAWSTTKVPNKCGTEEQRAEAREAAQILQRCPANDERRNVRSDKIKQWEAKIRQDERDKIEGRGLYAGYPHGGGFIQPTGGMIKGGSIGARLSAPTNVGAGGNLLSPFAVSKRPQAAYANFHMLQQMPVALQPQGMFSSR